MALITSCCVLLMLVLGCNANQKMKVLQRKQKTFESWVTQDMSYMNEQITTVQEDLQLLTQMVNASLQRDDRVQDTSQIDVEDIGRKLSRATRQLHVAFANQKMAISNDLTRMGETISSTREELKEQVEGIQKKVLSSEIRMQVNEENTLEKLDNYTKAVVEQLANLREEYSNSIKTQIDEVLLQIQNHSVSVRTQLQGVAIAPAQNRTLQLVEEISGQSKTIDERVFNIQKFLQQTTVRLNGPSAGNGRIEILHDGKWGTVCGDRFDDNNYGATVVCKMLGYTSGVHTRSYGRGDGPIWLDNVQCTGAENHILDCPRHGFGHHNCGHHEDVGVECS